MHTVEVTRVDVRGSETRSGSHGCLSAVWLPTRNFTFLALFPILPNGAAYPPQGPTVTSFIPEKHLPPHWLMVSSPQIFTVPTALFLGAQHGADTESAVNEQKATDSKRRWNEMMACESIG